MAQTNINIRMDEGLKKDFDGTCNELGMSMTTAFNIFARAVVRQRGIPFNVSLNIPNAETVEAINEVQAMKDDPNIRLYSSFGELLKDVESDV